MEGAHEDPEATRHLAGAILASLSSSRHRPRTQVHRNGFEASALGQGPRRRHVPRSADIMTEDGPPHSGQRCELIQLEVEAGSSIEYHYDWSRPSAMS
jgi:hypothetical protein